MEVGRKIHKNHTVLQLVHQNYHIDLRVGPLHASYIRHGSKQWVVVTCLIDGICVFVGWMFGKERELFTFLVFYLL